MLQHQHAVYSVASPDGAAAILWGDAARAEDAASRLKLTSDDLLAFGIVDEVIAEPIGGAHRDAAGTVSRVLDAVVSALDALGGVPPDELRDRRYRKFRRIGSNA
ncbi:MAG TPA: hypothetical protein VHT53_13470 [Candidatus Elarobacter sp.]|nr:hypothetical protein [Candidatus Elarobacter sp.]